MEKNAKKKLLGIRSEYLAQNIKYFWKQKNYIAVISSILVVFDLVLPIIYLLAACFYKDTTGNVNIRMYERYKDFTDNQLIYSLFISSLTPMLLFVASVLIGACTSASSFITEKERSSMQTLIYAPISPSTMFSVKVASAFVNALIISVGSALILTIVSTVGCLVMSVPQIFTLSYIIESLLIMPALLMLSILVTFLMNVKVKRVMSSFSTVGYVGLPFILFYIGEFTGLFRITNAFLVFIFIVLLIADFSLIVYIRRNVSSKKLLGMA
ncbi:MAG: hypothetical protein Q4C42_10280 [Clostridia bacterium]|nr:hypothetical protein [Clostridia bacterium]